MHSLLLRLMAERTITAFNREYHFPDLLVFADRNRIEREETFELPAAARDRFLMEIAIETPADPTTRRSLAFDPRFHDADAAHRHRARERARPPRAQCRRAATFRLEVRASEALERYVLDLWQALRDPAEAGIELAGHRHVAARARGRQPARHELC